MSFAFHHNERGVGHHSFGSSTKRSLSTYFAWLILYANAFHSAHLSVLCIKRGMRTTTKMVTQQVLDTYKMAQNNPINDQYFHIFFLLIYFVGVDYGWIQSQVFCCFGKSGVFLTIL